MTYDLIIPDLGATGSDILIAQWLVNEGDFVRSGTPLLVVETDKATEDIPAFRDGYVRQILAPAGSELEPGTVIALLTDTADEVVASSSALPQTEQPVANAAATRSPVAAPAAKSVATNKPAALTPRQRAFLERTAAKGNANRAATQSADQTKSSAWLLDVFRRMVLIRRYEEHLYHLFLQGQVPGTLHQCQGQEAVAVGVCSALRVDDLVFSTHRPVGHLIAKGASVNALTAEIWGKATGCVGGKGGQMHLADFSVGAMVSNAIVGANIPIATGAAMAFRLRGLDRVAVSFFGDGASNIGAFHEGLNLATVRDAPVVFVCENNLYAASTHISETLRIADIADRAKAYGMPGLVVDGMDVLAVYEATREAVDRARAGNGPTLLECKTYRYRGHSRGDPGGYRDRTEHDEWSQRDPIEKLRRTLQGEHGLEDPRLAEIERQCQAEVEAAVAFAVASADPAPETCFEHVLV